MVSASLLENASIQTQETNKGTSNKCLVLLVLSSSLKEAQNLPNKPQQVQVRCTWGINLVTCVDFYLFLVFIIVITDLSSFVSLVITYLSCDIHFLNFLLFLSYSNRLCVLLKTMLQTNSDFILSCFKPNSVNIVSVLYRTSCVWSWKVVTAFLFTNWRTHNL